MLEDKQYWEKKTHTHTPLSSVLSLLQLCFKLIKKSFVLALVLKKIKIMENTIVLDIQFPVQSQICFDLTLPQFFF